jgi:hypothetical protein
VKEGVLVENIKRFLRRSIPSDPHLWIALVGASVFLLMEILHWLEWLTIGASYTGVVIVIMILIISLVADRLKEGDQVRENAEKLGKIAQSMFDKKVALRGRPSSREEYDYLWGGYTGNYFVFNPSYRVDKNIGKEEIVKLLLHRYQAPHFGKARYLFLTKDEFGKQDLETFRELMVSVKREYPGVVGKIEVRELDNRKASSAAEMYLGERHGEFMCVLELKEPDLDSQHGMPHYYLVIQDRDVFEHYRQDHFEPAWNNTNSKDVHKFWE